MPAVGIDVRACINQRMVVFEMRVMSVSLWLSSFSCFRLSLSESVSSSSCVAHISLSTTSDRDISMGELIKQRFGTSSGSVCAMHVVCFAGRGHMHVEG